VKLNANRHVVGTLRGYDAFMNLVLDEAVEQGIEKHNLGMVSGVSSRRALGLGAPSRGHGVTGVLITPRGPTERETGRTCEHDAQVVVRGNSVVSMEALQKV
jgi:small nuclear ribonucleoprotein (snRNP)-like protein